jgi:hypothetical protein
MRFSLLRLVVLVPVVALSIWYTQRVDADYRFAIWIGSALTGVVLFAKRSDWRSILLVVGFSALGVFCGFMLVSWRTHVVPAREYRKLFLAGVIGSVTGCVVSATCRRRASIVPSAKLGTESDSPNGS